VHDGAERDGAISVRADALAAASHGGAALGSATHEAAGLLAAAHSSAWGRASLLHVRLHAAVGKVNAVFIDAALKNKPRADCESVASCNRAPLDMPLAICHDGDDYVLMSLAARLVIASLVA